MSPLGTILARIGIGIIESVVTVVELYSLDFSQYEMR